MKQTLMEELVERLENMPGFEEPIDRATWQGETVSLLGELIIEHNKKIAELQKKING